MANTGRGATSFTAISAIASVRTKPGRSRNISRSLHYPPAHILYAAAIVPSAGAAFEIKHVPIPAPAHGEVVVKTSACGLCHSDAYCRMGHYPGVTVRLLLILRLLMVC